MNFQQYFMQKPPPADPAYDFAKEYHDRCEAFDQTVCTGTFKDGSAMPMTADEQRSITRNAENVRADISVRATAAGVTPDELRRAIRDYRQLHH
jgi:hypothetical protein